MMSARPIFAFFPILLASAGDRRSLRPSRKRWCFKADRFNCMDFSGSPQDQDRTPPFCGTMAVKSRPDRILNWRSFIQTTHTYSSSRTAVAKADLPAPYIQDLVSQAPLFERGRRMMQLQEEEVQDVVSALRFLKSQTFVDGGRVAISGRSYGGIQTLLAGELELGVKALVPFAPGAMSWNRNAAIAERLSIAVARARAPVFLLQAKNDYSLGPSHVLTKEAGRNHKEFESKIYPAFGRSEQDGHWRFCSSATDVWGNDVLAFLEVRTKLAAASEVHCLVGECMADRPTPTPGAKAIQAHGSSGGVSDFRRHGCGRDKSGDECADIRRRVIAAKRERKSRSQLVRALLPNRPGHPREMVVSLPENTGSAQLFCRFGRFSAGILGL